MKIKTLFYEVELSDEDSKRYYDYYVKEYGEKNAMYYFNKVPSKLFTLNVIDPITNYFIRNIFVILSVGTFLLYLFKTFVEPSIAKEYEWIIGVENLLFSVFALGWVLAIFVLIIFGPIWIGFKIKDYLSILNSKNTNKNKTKTETTDHPIKEEKTLKVEINNTATHSHKPSDKSS